MRKWESERERERKKKRKRERESLRERERVSEWRGVDRSEKSGKAGKEEKMKQIETVNRREVDKTGTQQKRNKNPAKM